MKVFAGWGKSKTSQVGPSVLLEVITTKILSLGNCQRTSFGANAGANHICALAKFGVGACDGDSGGPLVWNNTVVGVASFVRPCARNAPDIFSSVHYYYDWIMEKTDNLMDKRTLPVTEEAMTEEAAIEEIFTEEIATEEFATEETITENSAEVECSKSKDGKCSIM